MKRFWLSLATFSLVEWIGRHPAIAGAIMLLGAGGGIVGGSLITPSITPQAAPYFNQSQSYGVVASGLTPATGSFNVLSTDPTGSTAILFEVMVDPHLGNFSTATEALLNTQTAGSGSGLVLVGNGGVRPNFQYKLSNGGNSGVQWWNAASALPTFGSLSGTTSTTYNTGIYTGTATGGGCRAEPTLTLQGGNGAIAVTNPGFDCTGWPTPSSISAASLTGFGQQQVTGGAGATTCALVNSNAQVTANVPAAHGITPGLTYTMQGFSPAGYNTTYTALPGTTGTTLVGSPTSHAACPAAVTAEGTALSGTGNAITFPAIGLNAFTTGGTGITTNNGQHICGAIIENGDDSAFPGLASISMTDVNGVALDGSPRITQNLNQGGAFFTGYTTVTAQSPASPALHVVTMTPFTISSALFNTGSNPHGTITFTMSGAIPSAFIPGTEFTVSGAVQSAVNITYVAIAGTTGSTVVGNPLSGPNGILQPITTPGAITFSSGQLVTVILPGQLLTGTDSFNPVDSILPYGTFGGSGTGSTGTYGLNRNQVPTSFTGVIDASGVLTASGVAFGGLGAGSNLTWTTPSGSATITQYGTGVLNNGTYQTNAGGAVVSQTMTNTGAMWSSGTPGALTAISGFYYSWAGVSGGATIAATKRTSASLNDLVNVIGAGAATITPFSTKGWGGAIGNVGMLYGPFPMASDSTPSATAMASLCKKTTTIPAFATANSMTVNSLYELNDIGIFGDSSVADFHGHTATNQLTIDSTETGSTVAIPAGTKITGPGLPAGLTVSSGSASPYTLSTSVGTVASEAMKAGAWGPATPVASSTVSGYIDGSPATTLHVTALQTASGSATFTGSLTSEWTAAVAATTGVMTISAVSGGGGVCPGLNCIAAIGVGTLIDAAPGTTAFPQGQLKVVSLGTGAGAAGTYNVVNVSGGAPPTAAISSQLMDGSGVLPAGPTTLNTSGTITGTIAIGQYLTDGGVSITGQPLLITAGSGTKWTVNANYYPAISADTGLVASLSTIIPGEYIRNAALTTPVKILAFNPGPCTSVTTAAILNGGLGCYTLSNSTNGAQGSSGSPLTLVGTTITDGGAIAPGPALTILDQGPNASFPLTNIGAGTGGLALSGTYDSPTLGGTPTSIQVLVSNSAGGPALTGCTPCNWGTLTGSISGGSWSGSISGIPAGGPYSISVRAANGTAYATLPSTVRIGVVVDFWGEGSVNGITTSSTGGWWFSFYSGLWGKTSLLSQFSGASGSSSYLVVPIGNFLPAQGYSVAGDRFGVNGTASGAVLPEGLGNLEQTMGNASGWPMNFLDESRDGIGIAPFVTGNVTQTETIDVGDGTKKIWCSQATLCPGASGGTVGRAGFLGFNAATLTGGWFAGHVSTVSSVSTVTIDTYVGGAVEPGMILSGVGITGTPHLLNCTSCPAVTLASGVAPTTASPQSSTWVLDTNLGTIGSENMRADPTPAMIPFGLSSTPYPTYNFQTGSCCTLGSGFGAYLIKAGTFQITDNGTVVCQDSQTFAYSNTGGNCTGAGISSSFVNYQTGDYQISFTSAPTTGHVITAQWVNIAAPESVNAALTSRPQGMDFFGDGTASSGSVTTTALQSPAGVNAHVFMGGSSDTNQMLVAGGTAGFTGGQFGLVGYADQVRYLYNVRYPTIPGYTSSVPFVASGFGRAEGPLSFNFPAYQNLGILTQLYLDMTTPSTFSGSIASNVLTLSADSVGPMWEGEIVGGGNLLGTSGPSGTGVYITSLASGVWGKASSSYNLSGMSAYNPGGTATGAFFNDAFFKGGNAFYDGALYDVQVQAGSPGSTVTAGSGHEAYGFAGGARDGRRKAAMLYQGLLNSATPNDPTADRTKTSATGCDAAALANPCFDIGATFQASHAATWSAGGNVFTVTSGLSAHARPFVVGQAVACASCNTGLVITSVSLPPTQDVTRTNAGQVGNTFTFTVANASAQAIGGSGTGTVTAGCSGTSGSGSNCIDMAFSINTTGTFGTAKALATCGENNLNGNSPNWVVPSGICQDNGIGTLIRTFRIGTAQNMVNVVTGSLFDDGADLAGGNFTQGGAFTCNIVAALIVQCVKAPVLASTGLLSSIGQWSSGSTFVNYGDTAVVTGRQGSMLGAVGGQSLPFSSGGTGYSNGRVQASCPSIQASGFAPWFDVKTNSGVITDVYPSATTTSSQQPTGLGVIAAGCTLTPPTGTGFNSSGAITLTYAPLEGLHGIATFNTDSNMTGLFLYGNEGFPGNPLNVFYTNGQGGYFEPGDAVRPFGEFQGESVSG